MTRKALARDAIGVCRAVTVLMSDLTLITPAGTSAHGDYKRQCTPSKNPDIRLTYFVALIFFDEV